MSDKKKPDFETGVWRKQDKNGNNYYTVGKPILVNLRPGQYWVNVYPNTKKNPDNPEESKFPDARVTLSLAQARYDAPEPNRQDRVHGVLNAAQSMASRPTIKPNSGHPGASNDLPGGESQMTLEQAYKEADRQVAAAREWANSKGMTTRLTEDDGDL